MCLFYNNRNNYVNLFWEVKQILNFKRGVFIFFVWNAVAAKRDDQYSKSSESILNEYETS